MILVLTIIGFWGNDMDIENRIIRIENEIRYFKTSQDIGQSNSMNYKIVENGEMTVTTNNYGTGSRTITFKSSGRAFPHFSFHANSYPSGVTIIVNYNPQYGGWEQQAELYEDSMTVTVRAGNNQTVTVYFTLYADTPGIYTVS